MISRFILLGRINDTDELSEDREHWRILAELPELVPEVMRNVVTGDDRRRLLVARMHEDERLADDRRHVADDGGHTGSLRHRMHERRAPEPARFRTHRKLRSKLAQPVDRGPGAGVILFFVLGLFILAVMGAVFYARHPASINVAGPDCAAPAAPGVNWSHCHMEGASLDSAKLTRANLSNASLVGANLVGSSLGMSDLRYANLGAANLRNADLRSVDMKGAVLHRADLAGADLTDANLSYANLLGANFSGAVLKDANLSKATWVDGRECAVASMGECK